MAILKRLLGLKRETSAKAKKKAKTKTKTYKNPITGRRRIVTKETDGQGRKTKSMIIREKGDTRTRGNSGVRKDKRVMKGQGKDDGSKMTAFGRYKVKSKNTKRVSKLQEPGTKSKIKKLSKKNKGKSTWTGRSRKRRKTHESRIQKIYESRNA